MQIFINAVPVEVSVQGISLFPELLSRIEEIYLNPKGEVMTSLFLNGQEVSEEMEKDLLRFRIERVFELHLRTATPMKLAIDSISQVPEIFLQLEERLTEVVELFQQADDAKALNRFILIPDGLSWFTTIWQSIHRIFDAEMQQSKDPELQNFIFDCQQLSDLLQRLAQVQEEGDMGAFCDLLDYELKGIFEKIRLNSPAVLDFLESQQNKA